MTVQNKRIFASILLILISFVCFSQGVPEPLPPSGIPPVGNQIPIDGGLLFGMAFALFYGVKKLIVKHNN